MSVFDLIEAGELDARVTQEEDLSSWVIHDPEAERDLEAIRARKSKISDPNTLFKSIRLSASDARIVREDLRRG